jgi:hypothetical protein
MSIKVTRMPQYPSVKLPWSPQFNLLAQNARRTPAIHLRLFIFLRTRHTACRLRLDSMYEHLLPPYRPQRRRRSRTMSLQRRGLRKRREQHYDMPCGIMSQPH